ncbi:MAG: undecaprenyl-diphosphate phosphatase, partial [Candidatus Peregrinibacteria bacterium]
MIGALIAWTKGFIVAHGYGGLFALTLFEQFIFPLPVDEFLVLGASLGMVLNRMVPLVLIATMLGAFIGYYLGKILGHPAATWLFGKKRMDQGEQFVKKWGFWAVVIGGFTPIPFKAIAWLSGIFEMPLWKFTLGTIVGRFPRYLLVMYAGNFFFEHKLYATTEMSAVLLGGLQGLTEFLPISSSGHLALLEHFLKLPETITAAHLAYFDILLHGGSLLAILLYFWRDWVAVIREMETMLKRWSFDKNALASKLILGTIPAILAGLLFGGAIDDRLRELTSIGTLLSVMAVLEVYADWPQHGGAHTATVA